MKIKAALNRRLAEDAALDEPQLPCETGTVNQAPAQSFIGHCDDISSGASSVKLVMRRIRDQAADSGPPTDPTLFRLSNVSGHNDVRDFWSEIDVPVEIESINVPVQSPKPPHTLSMKSFPIVHPHRLLSCLFDYVGLQIAQSEVRQYWTHARSMGEEWALEHPASWDHIPVGIHGDAAKLWTQYKFEKVVAIWMNVILFRPSSVRHSRFLLFSCPHALMVKNRTLNRVFRRLVWSFNAAFEGINPTVGEGGRALTGNDLLRAGSPITSSNHRFALCELRGDWEYHRDVFRFTASWQGIDMCFRCPAKSKGAARDLYHNLGPDCAWVHEEFNLAQFISRRLKDRHLSPLLNLKGFHPGCLQWCVMHIINLGLLFPTNGGALLLLCELGWFGGGDLSTQLEVAYANFVDFCKQNAIRQSQPPFTVKMVLKKTGQEMLTAKAYNGRCVLSWLAHCLLEAMEVHTDNDLLVLESSCLSALSKFFSLMESHGRYLTQSAATAMHDAGMRFLKVFKVLCREHVRMGKN